MISLFLLIHWFGVLREGFGLHFCVFWWPWGHFFWFLRVLETGLKFYDFLWFGMAKLEMVSRSMFLVIRGWKWCQNAMAACAITIVKTMCFEWFRFFYLFTDLVSWGRDLGIILDGFGCPEDSLCGFEGSWKQVGILMYLGISPWDPRILRRWEWKVKRMIRGPRETD